MNGLPIITLREYLLPGPTKKEASAFRDTVTSNNLRRQRVLARVVIGATLIFTFLEYLFMRENPETGLLLLFPSVSAQIFPAVFMTVFLYATRYPLKPIISRCRFWEKAFVAVTLSWAAVYSGALMSVSSGTEPYIIVVLSIAAVLFLDTVQGIVVFALGPALFMASAVYFGVDGDRLTAGCASAIPATILAFIISRINFIMLLRNFRDAEYIAGQKRELIESNERLHQLSFLDPLTNIANRRFLEMSLLREWKQQSRSSRPLSVIMIDIDWFKSYNDTYGHLAGDDCLRLVASELKASVKRPSDLVTRFGGEEFCVLLPETEREGAIRVGRRMLQAIRKSQIPHQGSPQGLVTVSMGIACCEPDLSGRFEDLLRAADAALYNAKTAGKNRIAWCSLPRPINAEGSGEEQSPLQSFRIVDFNRGRNSGQLSEPGADTPSLRAARN